MSEPRTAAPAGTVLNPFCYIPEATDAQLQRFLMLGVVVAGKKATTQEKKLDEFFLQMRNHLVARRSRFANAQPFEQVTAVTTNGNDGFGERHLMQLLRNVRLGKYKLLFSSFRALAWRGLDLRTCTRDDLMSIPGVGMKTASFFLLFTRRDAEVACLDTHVLRYLRTNKVCRKIPTKPPGSKKEYLRLEKAFLKHVKANYDKPVAAVDFSIWLAAQKKNDDSNT